MLVATLAKLKRKPGNEITIIIQGTVYSYKSDCQSSCWTGVTLGKLSCGLSRWILLQDQRSQEHVDRLMTNDFERQDAGEMLPYKILYLACCRSLQEAL